MAQGLYFWTAPGKGQAQWPSCFVAKTDGNNRQMEWKIEDTNMQNTIPAKPLEKAPFTNPQPSEEKKTCLKDLGKQCCLRPLQSKNKNASAKMCLEIPKPPNPLVPTKKLQPPNKFYLCRNIQVVLHPTTLHKHNVPVKAKKTRTLHSKISLHGPGAARAERETDQSRIQLFAETHGQISFGIRADPLQDKTIFTWMNGRCRKRTGIGQKLTFS